VGGVYGAILGVSDLDAASRFYRDVLGYDRELYRLEGAFDDLRVLPGGDGRFRRLLLARSAPSAGPFSELLGPSELELVQALDRRPRKIFDGRFWGDLGFIHLCFDVGGIDEHKSACAEAGHPFTVDSNPGGESFDMGQAAGRFAYVEDPDGTLIELVETHRVPIAAKLGWFLDLRRRDPAVALPRWMLRALALGRRHG
jgi:catechol 2,3-dioxygenase-like lactoylglutathione lyase family enzyme